MSAETFALLVAAAIAVGGTAILALVVLVMQARQSARVERRLNPGGAQVSEFTGARGGELLQDIAVSGKKVEALLDTNRESIRLLLQAGWRTSQQRALYYASQVLTPLILIVPVVMLALVASSEAQPMVLLLFSLMALILGLLLPRMVLRAVATARVRRIKSEVPLFIHLLVLLFEAGLSTRQAFASLVRDGRGVLPELGREFELILRQMEAGGETGELLNNLSHAIALDDLGSVLALLRQVDRYGGEVRDPLLELLEVIEERRSLDIREMVNLISGRMTVVMVMFFFPALLIFVAGPAFMAIIVALREAVAG